MEWFGQIEDGIWRLDELAAVKEVGLGVLRAYKVTAYIQTVYVRTVYSSRCYRMTLLPRQSSLKNGNPP